MYFVLLDFEMWIWQYKANCLLNIKIVILYRQGIYKYVMQREKQDYYEIKFHYPVKRKIQQECEKISKCVLSIFLNNLISRGLEVL